MEIRILQATKTRVPNKDGDMKPLIYKVGQIVDLPDGLAKEMMDRKLAEDAARPASQPLNSQAEVIGLASDPVGGRVRNL